MNGWTKVAAVVIGLAFLMMAFPSRSFERKGGTVNKWKLVGIMAIIIVIFIVAIAVYLVTIDTVYKEIVDRVFLFSVFFFALVCLFIMILFGKTDPSAPRYQDLRFAWLVLATIGIYSMAIEVALPGQVFGSIPI